MGRWAWHRVGFHCPLSSEREEGVAGRQTLALLVSRQKRALLFCWKQSLVHSA